MCSLSAASSLSRQMVVPEAKPARGLAMAARRPSVAPSTSASYTSAVCPQATFPWPTTVFPPVDGVAGACLSLGVPGAVGEDHQLARGGLVKPSHEGVWVSRPTACVDVQTGLAAVWGRPGWSRSNRPAAGRPAGGPRSMRAEFHRRRSGCPASASDTGPRDSPRFCQARLVRDPAGLPE